MSVDTMDDVDFNDEFLLVVDAAEAAALHERSSTQPVVARGNEHRPSGWPYSLGNEETARAPSTTDVGFTSIMEHRWEVNTIVVRDGSTFVEEAVGAGEFTVNCRRREEDASLEVQNVVVVARSGGSAMDIPGEAIKGFSDGSAPRSAALNGTKERMAAATATTGQNERTAVLALDVNLTIGCTLVLSGLIPVRGERPPQRTTVDEHGVVAEHNEKPEEAPGVDVSRLGGVRPHCVSDVEVTSLRVSSGGGSGGREERGTRHGANKEAETGQAHSTEFDQSSATPERRELARTEFPTTPSPASSAASVHRVALQDDGEDFLDLGRTMKDRRQARDAAIRGNPTIEVAPSRHDEGDAKGSCAAEDLVRLPRPISLPLSSSPALKTSDPFDDILAHLIRNTASSSEGTTGWPLLSALDCTNSASPARTMAMSTEASPTSQLEPARQDEEKRDTSDQLRDDDGGPAVLRVATELATQPAEGSHKKPRNTTMKQIVGRGSYVAAKRKGVRIASGDHGDELGGGGNTISVTERCLLKDDREMDVPDGEWRSLTACSRCLRKDILADDDVLKAMEVVEQRLTTCVAAPANRRRTAAGRRKPAVRDRPGNRRHVVLSLDEATECSSWSKSPDSRTRSRKRPLEKGGEICSGEGFLPECREGDTLVPPPPQRHKGRAVSKVQGSWLALRKALHERYIDFEEAVAAGRSAADADADRIGGESGAGGWGGETAREFVEGWPEAAVTAGISKRVFRRQEFAFRYADEVGSRLSPEDAARYKVLSFETSATGSRKFLVCDFRRFERKYPYAASPPERDMSLLLPRRVPRVDPQLSRDRYNTEKAGTVASPSTHPRSAVRAPLTKEQQLTESLLGEPISGRPPMPHAQDPVAPAASQSSKAAAERDDLSVPTPARSPPASPPCYHTPSLSPFRHVYEIIREGAPCRMYFDLEFARGCNPGLDGEELVRAWINVVAGKLHQDLGISIGSCNVLDLDSSTPKKFSRHLILHLPGDKVGEADDINTERIFSTTMPLIQRSASIANLFKDNSHVGQFVNSLAADLECWKPSPLPESSQPYTPDTGEQRTTAGRSESAAVAFASSNVHAAESASVNTIRVEHGVPSLSTPRYDGATGHIPPRSNAGPPAGSTESAGGIAPAGVKMRLLPSPPTPSGQGGKSHDGAPTSATGSKGGGAFEDDGGGVISDHLDGLTPHPPKPDNGRSSEGTAVTPSTGPAGIDPAVSHAETCSAGEGEAQVFREASPVGGALDRLWVRDGDGRRILFADVSVYTRNRCFRLLGSSKFGKSAALRVADSNQRTMEHMDGAGPAVTQSALDMARIVLNDSLIVPAFLRPPGEPYLTVGDGEKGPHRYSRYGRAQTSPAARQSEGKGSHGYRSGAGGNFDRADESGGWTVTSSGFGLSPFPAVDDFLRTLICNGGVRGDLRQWSYAANERTHTDHLKSSVQSGGIGGGRQVLNNFTAAGYSRKLTHQVANNRWCYNIGRPHKSNHIFLVTDLSRGEVRQHCHDQECRRSNYRSQPVRLPPTVIPSLEDLEGYELQIVLAAAIRDSPADWEAIS